MQVEIRKEAQKFIKKQNKTYLKSLERLLRKLERCDSKDDFSKFGINTKPLKNSFYYGIPLHRFKVKDTRLIYYITASKITVVIIDAGNRGDIYKKL